MFLSIIIVNWNTSQLLINCLGTVQENLDVLEVDQVETIVVDNASDDESVEIVRRLFPWFELIANHP